MDGLTGGRRIRLFEKTFLFLLSHPVWWRALFFPQYSSFIGLSKRKLRKHSSSRKSVSRPCLSIQYAAPSFITRLSSLPAFFHLGRFFLSFSQLFSSVTAPSYHPALTWSPRLRNILSSVVPLAYYFISDTFTLSNASREKMKEFCLFNMFHVFS